jgi:hypothetical protein
MSVPRDVGSTLADLFRELEHLPISIDQDWFTP